MNQFIGNNLWPAEAHEKLLQILPQQTYHASATINATPAALRRLAVALIEAAGLAQGAAPVEVAMMASDGEGYAVVIQPMSEQQIDASPLPYAQLGHDWDMGRCWNCPHKDE